MVMLSLLKLYLYSCNFAPDRHFVPHFHVLHFHVRYFHVLQFHVLLFHAVQIAPSFLRPAISHPAHWSVNFMSVIFSQPVQTSVPVQYIGHEEKQPVLQFNEFPHNIVRLKVLGLDLDGSR